MPDSRRSSRPVRPRLTRAAAAVSALALLAAGCGTNGDGAPPTADALAAGQLLTHTPLDTAAALPSAASTELVTYASEGAQGQPIVVSGTVSVPKGQAPSGGWPVLSWAHGTSGFADTCAPSGDTNDGPDHDYFEGINAVLDSWVQQGYVVVKTDYEGLGTPGGHTYLNGVSEANTVVDIVSAAREMNPDVSGDWVVMGHSQGGQAALFTAQDGQQRDTDLDLKAAVAIAPGGTALRPIFENIASGGTNPDVMSPAAGLPFAPILLLGAQAADPKIDPYALTTEAAHAMITTTRNGCLAQIRDMDSVAPNEFFRPNADLGPLLAYLDAQDPTALTPTVPVMIAQGGADVVVPRLQTDALNVALCKVGEVDYQVYPDQDHRGAVPASQDDARAFVEAALAGNETPNTCE